MKLIPILSLFIGSLCAQPQTINFNGDTFDQIHILPKLEFNSLTLTLADINYAGHFSIGYKTNNQYTQLWNEKSIEGSSILVDASNSFAFYFTDDNNKIFHNRKQYWQFYQHDDTYLATVNFDKNCSYADVTFTIGAAIPEPKDYALFLGLGTILLGLFKHLRKPKYTS